MTICQGCIEKEARAQSTENVLREALADHRRELLAMRPRWEALRRAAQDGADVLDTCLCGSECCAVGRLRRDALRAALAALEETAPPTEEGPRPDWMPGGAYCDCGCVEFMAPSVPSVRVAALTWDGQRDGEFGPRWMTHTPTRCQWDDLERGAPSSAPNREALVAEVAALHAALATERARALEAGGFEGHPPGVCLEHSRFRLEGAGLIDTEGPLSLCTGCGKLPPHAGCQAICAACAPPTGACYCAGCQVAGKASTPPAPAAPSEEPGRAPRAEEAP